VTKNGTSRRDFLRGGIWGGLLVISPAALAACGSSSSTGAGAANNGKPKAGGSVTLARNTDAISLDPSAISDNESIWVCSNLFERLYESSPTGKGSIPSLATSYEQSSDHLTWTFKLRKGVQFSDGSPLTAADVKYSIDRCTASDANGWMNVAFKHVAAPDDHTVVITANYPADIPSLVSFYGNGILPANLQGKSAKEFFQSPVGTGAFTVSGWTPGNQMTLKRNEHYWRSGRPYLDTVALTVVGNDQTRILQLRGKQADIIEAPPWSQIESLKKDSSVVVDLFPSTRVDFLESNFRMPQLADVHVRRAISLALDRDAIVKAATFGSATPAGSIFTPTWPDYDASIKPQVRDLAGAKAELAKSAYSQGFAVDLAIDSGDTLQATGAQVVQSNLKELGIQVKIDQFESTALYSMVEKGNFQLYYSYVTLDLMDPFENVPYLLDPAADGVATWDGFKDPELSRLSTKAAETSDPVKAKKYYGEIQQRVANTAVLIPLYYLPYAWAQLPRVKGFVVPPTGDYRLVDVYVDD
jgi:peptide/nickel transport system substrate-binding protein